MTPTGGRRVFPAERPPVPLSLQHLSRSFGGHLVVKDFSVEVASGEFMTLLGPSGCGKTTTLRLIAGFLEPDRGSILIGGVDVTTLPPNERDIGFVFQNYSLFPHMTVADNVAYGLKRRHIPREECRQRVADALDMVELKALANRYPRQLSGGQQQRVALARAVVVRPKVLLLDEPLSNLDARLRQAMRSEIRQLQRELDMTTVFVTHDQEEALSMSDRVVVMNMGGAEQIGTPADVYRRPTTLFVAGFMGQSNVWQGRIERTGIGLRFLSELGESIQLEGTQALETLKPGGHAALVLRPEMIELSPAHLRRRDGWTGVQGTVEEISYLGAFTAYRVRTERGNFLRALRPSSDSSSSMAHVEHAGTPVILVWPPDAYHLILLT